MKDLLKQLLRLWVVESGKKILSNVLADSHSDEHKVAVWWYCLKAGKFEFSMNAKDHTDSKCFSNIDRNKPSWIRGRVFESSESGRFYISVYKESFRQAPLSGRLLNCLYTLIQGRLPETIVISGIVDEDGRDLLGLKQKAK